jgi:hypothetical protein
MGIEWLLIAAGVAILIALLALSRMLQKRQGDDKPAPLLKGDGKYAYTTRGCIPFSENFDAVRMARRIYFVEPTLLEVLLIPEPSNIEGKLAVAVTLDSKVLGYVPTQEAGEIHRYLLAHSSGIRAKAKFYVGSRPEYNGVMLDLAKPLRLEAKRMSK